MYIDRMRPDGTWRGEYRVCVKGKPSAPETQTGRWKLDAEGAIQVEVGVKKTMLGLTMNAEAWKIVREALRSAGATQKMMVVPGEAGETASATPRVFSRDSIEAVALGNPLVRQAQEMFHAEVRSVLDLRDKGKG